MPDETRLMTYKQLAAARSITLHAARNLARGKRWQRALGNDGKIRLQVPVEMIPEAPSRAPPQAPPQPPSEAPPQAPSEAASPAPSQAPPEAPPEAPSQAPSQKALDLLAEHIARLQGELEPLRVLPTQVAALQAALEAVTGERDRLLTREHLREQRSWWRRLAG